MTINLNTGIPHITDTQANLTQVGINYATGRVMLRVTLAQTGETRDYFVPGDIDTIQGLVAALSNLSGLRNALEQYIAQRVAVLSGNVT